MEDEQASEGSVHNHFGQLDTNKDDCFSYTELMKEVQSQGVFETHFSMDVKMDTSEPALTYSSLFHQFNHDSNGSLDLKEFIAEIRNDAHHGQWFRILACPDGFRRGQLLEEAVE
uniref:Uncharacterized protein n=1 Tax=Nelumbo nucifera TaxID=4432 RepID=A0A822Y8V9_NELNU|nr:TPA_asm: hypothetical protein HUJ06_030408 [Nelumbo nucifera]